MTEEKLEEYIDALAVKADDVLGDFNLLTEHFPDPDRDEDDMTILTGPYRNAFVAAIKDVFAEHHLRENSVVNNHKAQTAIVDDIYDKAFAPLFDYVKDVVTLSDGDIFDIKNMLEIYLCDLKLFSNEQPE